MVFFWLIIGAGADAVLRGRRPPPWLAAVLTGAGLAVAAAGGLLWLHPTAIAGALRWIRDTGESILAASYFTNPTVVVATGQQAGHALATGGGLLALAGACLGGTGRWSRLRWVPLAMLPVELLAFASGEIRVFSADQVLPAPMRDIVAAHPGDYRVLDLPAITNGYLLGAGDIWGNDPGVLLRYTQYMTFTQGGNPDRATQFVFFHNPPRQYDMLRLRYAFMPAGEKYALLENPSPMPHALLLTDYRVLPSFAAMFKTLGDPAFDPWHTVLLESPPDPQPVPADHPGRVRVVGETSDTLDLEADLASPALLLVTDLYSRDWIARALPGSVQQQYQVLPANYILRAVPLSAGHHELRMEYDPPSFRHGLAISAVAWLVWVGLWLRTRRPAAGMSPSKTGV
jgi:hypothetical protein